MILVVGDGLLGGSVVDNMVGCFVGCLFRVGLSVDSLSTFLSDLSPLLLSLLQSLTGGFLGSKVFEGRSHVLVKASWTGAPD